jgi:predicted nucleic acid-binding protein
VIVCDANVLVSFVLRAEETELVVQLLNVEERWVAPPLVLSELRSVLGRQVRAKRLRLGDAESAYSLALDTIEDSTLEPAAGRVMQLAAESACSTYDCEYVVVAEQLGCTLATFDRQILRAFPEIARHPKSWLS